jgi:signal transduction histidine kinase
MYNQQQRFNLHIAANLPLCVTDLNYLERILSELLNNACKYTPPHETITLAVQTLSKLDGRTGWIEGHHAQPRLQISVQNTGVEIAPSECDRIFEKFYRIPNNDPWKHGGTGLGLALVQKLVEAIGGTISVWSGDRAH